MWSKRKDGTGSLPIPLRYTFLAVLEGRFFPPLQCTKSIHSHRLLFKDGHGGGRAGVVVIAI
jgi:hypothetical protein